MHDLLSLVLGKMTQYDEITIVVVTLAEYSEHDKFPTRRNFVIQDDHRII